ncbi:MAG: hypothetical protein IKW70_06320 [Verrucomicrobia bacterium]|nr:hypothetical protein [Verrucomicrobiota bacterium]
MKRMLKIVSIILGVLIVLSILVNVGLNLLSKLPRVPEDYVTKVPTGGEIETKYLAMGEHEVSYFESFAMMSFEKFEIYYPSDIVSMDKALPVVVFVNGTGCKGSKYPALQKHLASWGFITIATEEVHAWNGFSAEMSVRYLELINAYDGEVEGHPNPFFGKIDLDCIGITGHSQGGFGVVNAITTERHHESYKAAVILSSNAQTNPALLWEADASLINAPTMIIGSTGNIDKLLASLESLQTLYSQIPDTVSKLLALRNDADHGQMLYYADGYVTAWFMWLLQGDVEAAKAFTGDSPGIMTNPLYQDQRIDIQ